jgi:hypothetical protein
LTAALIFLGQCFPGKKSGPSPDGSGTTQFAHSRLNLYVAYLECEPEFELAGTLNLLYNQLILPDEIRPLSHYLE